MESDEVKRSIRVDAETLLAIQDGNKQVIKEFKVDLSNTATEIKEYMQLHISPLKDQVKDLRVDVADLYEKDREMRDRVSKVEQRQSVDEGLELGKDKTEAKVNDKANISIGKMGLIITAAAVIGGGIGWLLSL